MPQRLGYGDTTNRGSTVASSLGRLCPVASGGDSQNELFLVLLDMGVSLN